MDRTLYQGPTTASMHKWSIFRLVVHTFWCTSMVSVGPIAVSNWSDEWLVTFSAPKTKSMVVSLKRDAHLYPPLSLDNSVVGEVSNHKHLGIVLSNDLGWANHIYEICKSHVNTLCYKIIQIQTGSKCTWTLLPGGMERDQILDPLKIKYLFSFGGCWGTVCWIQGYQSVMKTSSHWRYM